MARCGQSGRDADGLVVEVGTGRRVERRTPPSSRPGSPPGRPIGPVGRARAIRNSGRYPRPICVSVSSNVKLVIFRPIDRRKIPSATSTRARQAAWSVDRPVDSPRRGPAAIENGKATPTRNENDGWIMSWTEQPAPLDVRLVERQGLPGRAARERPGDPGQFQDLGHHQEHDGPPVGVDRGDPGRGRVGGSGVIPEVVFGAHGRSTGSLWVRVRVPGASSAGCRRPGKPVDHFPRETDGFPRRSISRRRRGQPERRRPARSGADSRARLAGSGRPLDGRRKKGSIFRWEPVAVFADFDCDRPSGQSLDGEPG